MPISHNFHKQTLNFVGFLSISFLLTIFSSLSELKYFKAQLNVHIFLQLLIFQSHNSLWFLLLWSSAGNLLNFISSKSLINMIEISEINHHIKCQLISQKYTNHSIMKEKSKKRILEKLFQCMKRN